jgi:hypothetical protein
VEQYNYILNGVPANHKKNNDCLAPSNFGTANYIEDATLT